MAPLRLPKVKSKGKTAPEPESHDDFMEAALVQVSPQGPLRDPEVAQSDR